MKRLLIIMTIANTIMFILASSPWHLLGAAVGAGYLMYETEDQNVDK